MPALCRGKLTVRIPRLGRRLSGPRCSVCEGYGTLPCAEVFPRDPVCTCGAGEFDEMTVHAADCDTVPCPFCQLADTPFKPRVLR